MSAENAARLPAQSSDLDLTPAASEALDINADLFRRQVLQELSRTHKRSGYRVRVSDVQQAADKIVAEGPRYPRVVRLLARLAFILAGLTLVVQVLIQNSETHKSWIFSLAAALAGISTGIALVLLIQDSRIRRREGTASSMEFVREVQSLEWSARRLAKQALGRAAENASLARILSAMEVLEVWTPDDSQIFRKLLSLRNSLVHEDSRVLSREDITFGLTEASRLSDLLRRGAKAMEGSGERHAREPRLGPRYPAFVYEERIVSILRDASFEVIPVQGDYGYDLLVETPRGSVALVIIYRDRGTLGEDVVRQLIDADLPMMAVALVTNVSLSRSAIRYLESLERDSGSMSAFQWSEEEPDDSLIQSIMTAAGNDY